MAARRRSRKPKRKPPSDPLARERALDALARMRGDRFSLSRAARESGTTSETVRKYVGSALRRGRNGRYAARPTDRLTRRLWILTPTGRAEVRVRSSRKASEIAGHMAAVDAYVRTGSTEALDKFRGRSVRSAGETHPYVLDPEVLDRLANAGEVSFERLYTLRA